MTANAAYVESDHGRRIRVRLATPTKGWPPTIARSCVLGTCSTVADGYKADAEKGFDHFAVLPDSGATYDEHTASACIAAIEHGACSLLKDGPPLNLAAPCDNVYKRGTRKLGEVCRSFYDCAKSNGQLTTCAPDVPNRIPDGGVAEASWSCVLYREVAEGESCLGEPHTEVSCQRPLICDLTLSKCVTPAARGDVCITGSVYGDTCATGSVCDRDNSKRCIKPPAVGDACGAGLPVCEGLACFEGKCREPLFVTSNSTACKP